MEDVALHSSFIWEKSSKITSGYELMPDNFYLEAMLTSLPWRATDCWDTLPWDMARLITASAQGQLDFGKADGLCLTK